MKFIGRERELHVLNALYNKDGFQMMVLYGRRRIGKTFLLDKFAEGKDPLFYTGIESKGEENLSEFSRAALIKFTGAGAGAVFASYSDALDFITGQIREKGKEKKQLIILDEFPYMAASSPELPSVLQRVIDRDWDRLNVMLVLCGSSITFMEEEVLGAKSPLFGRRTSQMDLAPFDYSYAARFVQDYTPEEKAIVYGVTGGVAKYLSLFDPNRSLDENLVNQFFDPAGYLYEEPKNLLRQEFRDISLYYTILGVIARGETQLGKISGKAGFDTPKTAQALRKLESVRIVRKDVPILNESKRNLSQYVLSDGMFRFWFRFIAGNENAIERGFGREYFAEAVKPRIHDYMGQAFESICQSYTLSRGIKGDFGFTVTRTGKWRGADPEKKEQTDIDVVGVSSVGKHAVIGECKFTNAPEGKQEYDTLADRARLIAPYKAEKYILFSLSGFTEWIKKKAEEDDKLMPISIGDLYEE
ncbi:MAG: ATP-binding protein [Eubacterium sp.]|jgi:AAA+ ATPase superfamily predicted ATPase